MTASVLIWAQHLLGSGHVQRAAAIATAIAARGGAVTLVLGGPSLPVKAGPGVTVARLPSLRAVAGDFTDLRDAAGDPVTPALWADRRTRLLELAETIRPDVVVTEMFPFGRKAFGDEVRALLEACPRARKVASVRDILVTKDAARRLAMVDLARLYDRILVHGDPAFLPFEASIPEAAALGDRLRHTGFVLAPRTKPGLPPPREPEVLVSAGGGAVGATLLRAALTARPMSAAHTRPWRLVAGAAADPAELATLWQRVPDGVVIDEHREDFRDLLAASAVSVSQAGYNTIAEALEAGARLVLVPFARGGEDEQTRRALRLVELRRATMVPERDLAPLALARAVDRALELPEPGPCPFALDGAERTAEAILELA